MSAYIRITGAVGIWCLTPLSTIFQLYRGGHFYCWRKSEYRRKPPTCGKSLTNFMLYRVHFVYTTLIESENYLGRRGPDCIVVDLQIPVESVSLTTKGMSSKPAHGEVYSIQH
jgi:hypothetical protein